MEDQLGALGLVLNATVLWNTIYMDKARAQRQMAGRPIPDQILAGISPVIFEHLNFSGRYPFNRPVLDRPLRDPTRHRTTKSDRARSARRTVGPAGQQRPPVDGGAGGPPAA